MNRHTIPIQCTIDCLLHIYWLIFMLHSTCRYEHVIETPYLSACSALISFVKWTLIGCFLHTGVYTYMCMYSLEHVSRAPFGHLSYFLGSTPQLLKYVSINPKRSCSNWVWGMCGWEAVDFHTFVTCYNIPFSTWLDFSLGEANQGKEGGKAESSVEVRVAD